MLLTALALFASFQDPSSQSPSVAKPASKDAELALAKFKPAPGIAVSLFAAEPMLANPVAFSIDEKGRVFVAETYRVKKGVLDMRDHRSWLDEDLACGTVEQRVANMKAHVKGYEAWSKWHEQVRLVEDTDGDGKADRASVFADGFHDIASGVAAGVLARQGSVYLTCIPDLVKLGDDGGTKATDQVVLSTGYGVHVSFYGHDLHGLRIGPDRKLYFSIGDRGLHVEKDGRVLDNPDCGAVLRCELDGSELEIFATGLRNPQELAFDAFGNLFTGDNNGDGGDSARLVHVVEGGDSGWRIGPQWMDDRGPWNKEGLWHLQHTGQPAWIVPPVAHLCSGPSGLCHYPGTGLPDRYQDHFFLVDFTGSPAHSGVRSFTLAPHGAGFELASHELFLWGLLATDCEFGPDGGLWVLDWVEGWEGPGKGRIYRATAPDVQKSALVAETKDLLRTSMKARTLDQLVALLGHADARVRTEAHFACADLGAAALDALTKVLQSPDRRMARIHALWASMLVARTNPKAFEPLLAALDDSDFEIRAQAARALGERRHGPAAGKLRERLGDPNARVRMCAATALGRIADHEAVDRICRVLADNGDRDPVLRHAASFALAKCATRDDLVARAGDPKVAVRMGVLLAMRHQHAPELVRFLRDPAPELVVEAARAIHDLPIAEGIPALADLVQAPGLTERPLADRAINAALRLGAPRELGSLLALVGRDSAPQAIRLEALWAVEHFFAPPRRDRVIGDVRPLAPRPLEPHKDRLAKALTELLDGDPDPLAEGALHALAALQIGSENARIVGIAENTGRSSSLRRAALDALDTLHAKDLEKTLRRLATDSDSLVRATVLDKLGKIDPAGTVPMLETALRIGSLKERQRAYATLGRIEVPAADPVFVAEFDRFASGRGDPDVEFDLLEAAGKRKGEAVAKALAAHLAKRDGADLVASQRELLRGGDRESGERLFRRKPESQCTKCHAVNGEGGNAAPDLRGVASRLSREKLLESLLAPSKVIAEGWGTIAIELKDSRVVKGVVKTETPSQLELQDEEGKKVVVAKDDIETRADPVSAMPPMGNVLSRRELRDVIAYLASLEAPPGK